MRFSVLGFRSDLRIELQAPVFRLRFWSSLLVCLLISSFSFAKPLVNVVVKENIDNITLKNYFFFQAKHMLLVVKRTVSMRRFF